MKKAFYWLSIIMLFAVITILTSATSQAKQDQAGIHEPGTGQDVVEVAPISAPVNGQVSVEKQPSAIESQLQNKDAEQPGIHEPGTGLAEPEIKAANQGTGQKQFEDGIVGLGETRAEARRSRVVNAVQAMERIAERNQGIGEQIRVLAQNQNRLQNEAEAALQTAQSRSKFAKFFIGPNYKQLRAVEENLANHTQNLAELKTLREQIQTTVDQSLLDEQIQIMEKIKQELELEVSESESGFSLFGWLSKMMAK